MTQAPEFSTELKTLAGEWLAYCAISTYFRDIFHEDMYDFSVFAPNLSIAEKFAKCPIYIAYHAPFNDAYLFLLEMGIIRRQDKNYVANCLYSEITEKIKSNIHKSNYSIPHSFVLMAGYHSQYFRENEREHIYIEDRCHPLFNTLRDEGFCRQNDERYYWTPKLRPYLEHRNIWANQGSISEEEKLFNSLSDDIKAKLHLCAEAKDLISACAVLTRLSGARLGVAKSLLENQMYPKIWGKSKDEKKDVTFRWYGPA